MGAPQRNGFTSYEGEQHARDYADGDSDESLKAAWGKLLTHCWTVPEFWRRPFSFWHRIRNWYRRADRTFAYRLVTEAVNKEAGPTLSIYSFWR